MKQFSYTTNPSYAFAKAWFRKLFPVLLAICALFLLFFSTRQHQPYVFIDEFNRFGPVHWQISGPWSNGAPFQNGWREDHLEFTNGVLRIRLDDIPCTVDPSQCANQPYASGEYQSKEVYHYGCLEGRFKAAQENGVVTSLFIYSGEPNNTIHDEIDIEILGNDPTKMQINYFTDGTSHPKSIDLGFNAASAFHTYAIEWTENHISWYADGNLLHTENGSNGELPHHAGYIMMNLWPVDETAGGWAGDFKYMGEPVYADYDWIKFSESNCKGSQ